MLTITIMDIDVQRLMDAERTVRSVLRQTGVKAKVMPVADRLELSRQGLIDKVPALKINGRVICTGQEITGEIILNAIHYCS